MELSETKDRIDAAHLPESVKVASRQLTEWLAELPEDQGRFLPLSLLTERFASELKEENLRAALAVLARSEFAVLEVSGYLDDSEEGPLLLSPSEYREVMHSGVLVHPETGNELGSPGKYLHLYFALRS